MEIHEVFAVGRVIERLMICAFGGLSLVFGWNLFRVGVVDQQSAELSAKGWRINLKRVGPGVFFVMLGSIILGVSLRSPLTLPYVNNIATSSSNSGPVSNKATEISSDHSDTPISYGEGDDPRISKAWVAALNTMLAVATPDKFPAESQRNAISRADKDIEVLRNALVIKRFGPSLLSEYSSYSNLNIVEV